MAALAVLLLPRSVPADVNAYATLTSEYIYRGLAASGGDAALQLAFDYQHRSGLFIGAWASTLDIDNAVGGRRDVELDYYAGYHYDGPGEWSGAITLMRYTYPGASGPYDYDYNEWTASAEWSERYFIEIGYSPDIYGTGRAARYMQLGTRHAVARRWVLSGAVGRNDLSRLGVQRYLHWDVGASASWSRFTVDLRWYDNESVYSGGYGGYGAGSRFAVSLSTAF